MTITGQDLLTNGFTTYPDDLDEWHGLCLKITTDNDNNDVFLCVNLNDDDEGIKLIISDCYLKLPNINTIEQLMSLYNSLKVGTVKE